MTEEFRNYIPIGNSPNESIRDKVLIAEFMNIDADISDYLEYISSGKEIRDKIGVDIRHFSDRDNCMDVCDFKFDSSWDWLMPVIEKIQGIFATKKEFGAIINICTGNITIACKGFYYCSSKPQKDWKPFDINRVYKAVVEFIKWYNENHDTKTKDILSVKDISK